jgi:hypothetical protein
MLTTALCPPYPAIRPSGTSIPKQHRSNRFVYTLHTTSSQDGHDVHRSADLSFRYRQSPNKIQTQRACSNRAATRVNILKCWEMSRRRNKAICRYFASSRNLWKPIVLPSHGRGRWFEPSIAHPLKSALCRIFMRPKIGMANYIPAHVQQPCSNAEELLCRVPPHSQWDRTNELARRHSICIRLAFSSLLVIG